MEEVWTMGSTIERLNGLEGYLKSQVVGQDDAMARVALALASSEFGLNETGPRPQGAYLFMGPSGVGKTSCCKAFTEYLFGSSELSMLYMNEYQSPGDVADLVLAIARYVSKHPEGTTLLCDEVEKAHKAIIDLFLSILDEGQLTVADGSRISVAKCYIVMTSNIGSERFAEMETTTYSRMESFAFAAARDKLRPELFNRLTERIVFRPLSQEVQINILHQLMLKKLLWLGSRLEYHFGCSLPSRLSIDEKSVRAHLLRKGFTTTDGARGLRNELNRQFNRAVIPVLLGRQMPDEGKFYADVKNDCLQLR
jgi:ATP-dependent Clp protease ATP-binding subunit ClpA